MRPGAPEKLVLLNRLKNSARNSRSDRSESWVFFEADRSILVVPSVKFNRSIGGYAHQPYDIKGERISDDKWELLLLLSLPLRRIAISINRR